MIIIFLFMLQVLCFSGSIIKLIQKNYVLASYLHLCNIGIMIIINSL
jgi:hypothetical protein